MLADEYDTDDKDHGRERTIFLWRLIDKLAKDNGYEHEQGEEERNVHKQFLIRIHRHEESLSFCDRLCSTTPYMSQIRSKIDGTYHKIFFQF